MISLLLAIAAAGLVAGQVVGARLRRRRPPASTHSEGEPVPIDRAGRVDRRLAGLPCTLGDVLVVAHGEEAWLTGVALFRERAAAVDPAGDPDRTVAALFVASGAGATRAVYARPAPASTVDWTVEVPADELASVVEPPSSLELSRERFVRVRRLPLAVEAAGTGAPELGASVILAEYEGASGATALLVVGAAGARIWRGRRLELGMFDILAGDGTTA